MAKTCTLYNGAKQANPPSLNSGHSKFLREHETNLWIGLVLSFTHLDALIDP